MPKGRGESVHYGLEAGDFPVLDSNQGFNKYAISIHLSRLILPLLCIKHYQICKRGHVCDTGTEDKIDTAGVRDQLTGQKSHQVMKLGGRAWLDFRFW